MSYWVDDLRTAVYETRTYGGVRGAPHQLQLVGPSTRLGVAILFFLPFGFLILSVKFRIFDEFKN